MGKKNINNKQELIFQGREIAILIYDITRKDSFEKLKVIWLKELKEHSEPGVVLGIAGNK